MPAAVELAPRETSTTVISAANSVATSQRRAFSENARAFIDLSIEMIPGWRYDGMFAESVIDYRTKRKKREMPDRILIIDDEPQITRVLRAALSAQSYDVRTANDPEEGLQVFKDWPPDLVITDLMMPGMSGVDVTRSIRTRANTPVLILSVRDHERTKVEALDAGADDYVTKPFSIQELLARVRAHLRRAPERTTAAIETGDFVIDSNAHTIAVMGSQIHLTPKEFDLLLHLARNAGKVMTHRALLTSVWGAQSAHQPEYLRVFVGQLRKKLEAESGKQYIQTEPWVGYRFVPEGLIGNED
jgi:two-component system KDP operon response regulator KdpE